MINSTITFTYVPLVLCESAQTLSPVFFFFKYFAVCVWDVSGVSDSGWLHDNLKWRSPVARIKCWRFTFLQITGMFTRVYVAFTMSTFLHFFGGGGFFLAGMTGNRKREGGWHEAEGPRSDLNHRLLQWGQGPWTWEARCTNWANGRPHINDSTICVISRSHYKYLNWLTCQEMGIAVAWLLMAANRKIVCSR